MNPHQHMIINLEKYSDKQITIVTKIAHITNVYNKTLFLLVNCISSFVKSQVFYHNGLEVANIIIKLHMLQQKK